MLFACLIAGCFAVCYCFPDMTALPVSVISGFEIIACFCDWFPHFRSIPVNMHFLCNQPDICALSIDTGQYRNLLLSICSLPDIFIIFQTDSDIIIILNFFPFLSFCIISEYNWLIFIQIQNLSDFCPDTYAFTQFKLIRILLYCVSINVIFSRPEWLTIFIFLF